MQDHPILGRLWLGYSPLLDAQRATRATRLTVFPLRPDAPPDADALLALLAEVWPPAAAGQPPALLLNVASETLLQAVLTSPQPYRPQVEVPAFLLADPALAAALAAHAAAGGVAVLRGQPSAPLPPALRACFAQTIVEPGEGGGAGALVAGDGSQATLDAALAGGAAAVIGWPFADLPVPPGGRTLPPSVQAIVELIDRVRREEPVERLEGVLKKDATLAFRLLRYLNSAAMGLKVEVVSLRHALQLLGYQRLGRWLAVLLASASEEPAMRPLMYAAIRRGLFFEELLRGGDDPDMRGELFICGIFSLLDRMLRLPFEQLLRAVPVPARVQQALLDGSGPFQPYLELARALENASLFDIRDAAAALLLGPADVNRALLRALVAAREVE